MSRAERRARAQEQARHIRRGRRGADTFQRQQVRTLNAQERVQLAELLDQMEKERES